MAVRMKDIPVVPTDETFIGRSIEISELLRLLDSATPVMFVHGLAGIGKSMLLDVFATRAREDGAFVALLDCRTIEPTERGLLYEISTAIGITVTTPEMAAERLGSLGPRVVLSLDNYEVFRLMDTWLRQVFLPLLPENVHFILAGSDRPVLAWLVAPSRTSLLRVMALGPLSEAESSKFLARGGIASHQAALINKFARGHPLALKLALNAAAEGHSYDGNSASGFHRVVEDLTRLYLTDIGDPLTRQVIEAASVVRRNTISLLQAMLPDTDARDAFERLQALPFVDAERDGLRMHDVVQQAIAATLRASDPVRYLEYRRSAWRQLTTEVQSVGLSDLWRYTADLLFLIENSAVREAFFPSGAPEYVVEPARPEDFGAIDAISRKHEPSLAADILDLWWRTTPESFRVARQPDGVVTGFYLMFDPANINAGTLRVDPVVHSWWQHIRNQPMPANQRALFIRRWLSRDHGDSPSPVQAACWLDIKRSYMEMRPRLRRVYLTVTNLSAHASAAQQLGFRELEHLRTEFENVDYSTAMLDFGPASIDGWLAGLAAAELGVEGDALLDIDAHELMLDTGRVKLSKMEFDIFHYLYQHKGKAVTRASLIENVWGYKHTGSNVVDATVKSLRKKLGAKSSAIETIRGSGYRFQKL
ncbi:MAG: winged helix-turn-helix domain-containing protein [Acidobacteriota bacterium]